MSGALPEEAEALVAAALGRWRAAPIHNAGPLVPVDPLRAIAAPCDVGPSGAGALDGWRIAVKDNIAVAGAPMAVGSGLPAFVPARDATVVERVRAAGGRIVAKAQCEAFLLGANSFSSRPDSVRNPYDLDRSAGGSSSGSAALLAARMADGAIGSDSGGSIRIPAAFCGIVGLKPTRGRVPCTGTTPMDSTLAVTGPMARSVADVARFFAILDGPDGVDPRQAWARREPERRFNAATDLCIGVLDVGLAMAEPPVGRLIHAALDAAERAGACRVAIDWPDFAEALEAHTAIYVMGQAFAADPAGSAGFALTNPDGWAAWRAGVPDAELPPELALEIAAGRALLDRDPALYGRVLRRAEDIALALDTLLADVDILALPTTAALPPVRPDGAIPSDLVYGDTRLTAAFNVTGHPALSLPAGLADGLPVGMQLVARRGADETLLAAAALIERLIGALPPPPGDFGEMA